MSTLTARTLITAIGEVVFASLQIGATGLIEDVSTDPGIRSESILTPTFLDLHVHGAAGEDVMSATPEGFSRMARFLARHGTSHFLPTTVTASLDDTLSALDRLADACERPSADDEAIPLGIHLEGPFLSHSKRGVHQVEHLRPASIEVFERLRQAARGHLRMMTVAPELKGATDLIRHATEAGVKVSLGHSNATAAETLAGIAAGAVSATHLFNAMRALDHREPGIVGTVLDTPALFADLICDGIHVAPAAVRLWLQAKGDHAILITDGISATGMRDGQHRLGPLDVVLSGERCSLADHPETLAGSVLTLNRAVANLMEFTGTSLANAVRCASSHPAALLGLQASVACLREGQPADLNEYTAGGKLVATYLRGRRLTA